MIKFTPDIAEFIKSNVKGTPNRVLCEMVNKEFNTDFTIIQIKNFKNRNNLSSGLNGYFKKGHVTHNKGKKRSEWMSEEGKANSRKTCFKKGNHSFNNANHNQKEIGSERIDKKDGYVYVKVDEHNKRKLKHRYIYEKHYGAIPKGYVCIFLDGDKRNFDIDNLGLISRNENKIMNEKRLRYDSSEATKSGINVAKLIVKIQERKKKHGN